MNLDFPDIITNLIDLDMLDSTERHIANFIYPLLRCDNIIRGVQQNRLGELKLYQKPNTGSFTLEIPRNTVNANWVMQVYNTTGQLVLSEIIPPSGDMLQIREAFPAGMYYLKLFYEKGQVIDYYSGTFSVVN
jgi:hypothetical protein